MIGPRPISGPIRRSFGVDGNMGDMRIANHVVDLVGNTPLVKLNKVVKPGSGLVAAKIEYMNPGGSAKDRIATRMIDAAEAAGS